MPLKLEEKFDVTDHDQKVDDIVTPPDLSSVIKRKLAKIQSIIIDLFHNGGLFYSHIKGFAVSHTFKTQFWRNSEMVFFHW